MWWWFELEEVGKLFMNFYSKMILAERKEEQTSRSMIRWFYLQEQVRVWLLLSVLECPKGGFKSTNHLQPHVNPTRWSTRNVRPTAPRPRPSLDSQHRLIVTRSLLLLDPDTVYQLLQESHPVPQSLVFHKVLKRNCRNDRRPKCSNSFVAF